jgi:tRNA pseudouridine55 synthase
MPRKQQPASIDGALVIDKPGGPTSHDVVEAARRALGFRQVGHLGTLDPLATGVLVLLLGRATRLAQFYAGRRKRYDTTFRFGFATDTYDADGEALGPDASPQLDRAQIESLAAARVGKFAQMPPAYSAKKIQGRPAHELARKNKPVKLTAAEVEVYEFRTLGVEGASARFSVECSAGTYIRSLAHEMGEALGCGAHLSSIVRTAVGEFTLDQAVPLETFERAAHEGRAAEWVLALENLLPNLPSVTVAPAIEHRVRHGTNFTIQLAQLQPGRATASQHATAELDSGEWQPARLRVFNQQQKLIAIAQAVVPRTYRPVVVLDAEP